MLEARDAVIGQYIADLRSRAKVTMGMERAAKCKHVLVT